MIKNIFKVILAVLIFVVIYLLQIYVINNTLFFGVNGNLCLMAVVVITVFAKDYVAYLTAIICGLTTDLLFPNIALQNLVTYIFIVVLLIGLKKMYKPDNKIAIIIFGSLATALYETLTFIFCLISGMPMINIFTFIFMVIKQVILNIGLAFLAYIALKFIQAEE